MKALFFMLLLIAVVCSQEIDSDIAFSKFGFVKEELHVPQCPSVDSRCILANLTYAPNQPYGPECWLESGKSFDCHFIDDLGLIECPKCYTHVGFCGYPKYNPNTVIKKKEDEEKKLSCPVVGEKCDSDGVRFDLEDSKAPLCWSKLSGGGWKCKEKSERCNDNEIDIEKCVREIKKTEKANPDPKNEELQCPATSDVCNFDGSLQVKISTAKGPKCWKQVNKAWICEIKENGKCSTGYTDITKCKSNSEVDSVNNTPSYCPKLDVLCTYSKTTKFALNDQNPPECWVSTKDGYACKYKRELKGGCPTGTLDTTPCRPNVISPLDTQNQCPKQMVKCTYANQLQFDIGSNDSPECWVKTLTGYICRYKRELGDSCPLNTLDATTCQSINESKDDCPRHNDRCFYNKQSIFLANSAEVPECWIKTQKGFFCKYKSELKGQCPRGSTDLASCKSEDPNPEYESPLPICPEADDECNNKSKSYKVSDKNVPECWAKASTGFICRYKSQVGGSCPKSAKDISTCVFKPPCPKYDDVCKSRRTYALHDFFAPTCWRRKKNYFECSNKAKTSSGTKECAFDQVDITKCDREKPPPPCPKYYDRCIYDHNLEYKANDSNAPDCWYKQNDKYICKFKFESGGKCKHDGLNIHQNCTFLKSDDERSQSELDRLKKECPKPGDRCLYQQKGFIVLGSSKTPECWAKTDNGYICKYKSELPKLDCPAKITVDVTKCPTTYRMETDQLAFIDDSLYFDPDGTFNLDVDGSKNTTVVRNKFDAIKDITRRTFVVVDRFGNYIKQVWNKIF